MDIVFNTGERICFAWRTNGALHISLVKAAPAGAWDNRETQWPVAASTTLTGENLLLFLEGFTLPILRRCMAVALDFPQEKVRNKEKY
jgi:hypothetical protein